MAASVPGPEYFVEKTLARLSILNDSADALRRAGDSRGDYERVTRTAGDARTRLLIWRLESASCLSNAVLHAFRQLEQHIDSVNDLCRTLAAANPILLLSSDARQKVQDALRSKAHDPSLPVLYKALDQIYIWLGELENSSQTAQAKAENAGSLHADIEGFVDASNQLEQTFRTDLEKSLAEAGGKVKVGTLESFWLQIPVIKDWDDSKEIGDPRDGTLVEGEGIKKTEHALKALRDAWSHVEASFKTSWASAHLLNMAKTCIILRHTQDTQVLDDLIRCESDDSYLPYTKQQLQTILAGSDSAADPELDHEQAVLSFLAEQYRAVPRVWQGHADLYENEPLPFKKHDQQWHELSGFANVDKVIEVPAGHVFARKVGKFAGSTKHLRNEFENLERLGDHEHIVQCVKSYTRGDEYALLLKPAADHNLWKLLQLYCSTKPRQKDMIRPALLRAFGCLTSSLDFIHSTTRHKDIKPQNILWYNPHKDPLRGKMLDSSATSLAKPRPPKKKPADSNIGDAVMLWADFGLAYNFSEKTNPYTEGGHQGTSRYAAPEYKDNWTRFDSFGTGSTSGTTGNSSVPSASEDNRERHGTEADVFALGCVFLEIISTIIHNNLDPSKAGNLQYVLEAEEASKERADLSTEASSTTLQGHSTKGQFRYRLSEIDDWVDQQSQLLHDHVPNQQNQQLLFLLDLSRNMIKKEQRDRYTVPKIVAKLKSAGPGLFCERCGHDRNRPFSGKWDMTGESIPSAQPEEPKTSEKSDAKEGRLRARLSVRVRKARNDVKSWAGAPPFLPQ